MWQFGEPSLEDLLSEPIIQRLMSADGVDEETVLQIASGAKVERERELIRTSGCPGIRLDQTRSDNGSLFGSAHERGKPCAFTPFLDAVFPCAEGA